MLRQLGTNVSAFLLAFALISTPLVGCSPMPRQQPTGEAIEDGVVTAKVKAKLIEDPVTKVHNINVETFKGTVQLSGFVENEKVRARALQLAKDTEGVKNVKDAMEVRRGSG
ncbi:MAG TPA: BON domain-containing protein [Steroidobacteraceae bacterium]